jgi:hypothetical protein
LSVDPLEESQLRTRPGSGGVGPDDAGSVTLRRVFVLLEAHRRGAVLSSRAGRPSRRYEERCLAAAIVRLQRHLRVAERLTGSEGIRWWVEDVLAEEGWREPEHGHRDVAWLSLRARRKASAGARRRFEAVTAEVLDKLGDAARSEQPTSEPAAQPERCTALTRRGTQCKNPAETNGLCGLHARLAVGPVLARDPEPVR